MTPLINVGCALFASVVCFHFVGLFWNLSCAADYEEPRVPLSNRVRSRSLKLLSFCCDIAAGVAAAGGIGFGILAGKLISEMTK